MLCSFSIVPDDYTYKTPISYLDLSEKISYSEFQVDINVLGLRNLESIGLLPVKKPFIKFNLRSLVPPEKAQALTNVKTNPSSTGSSPNINTLVTFHVDLPTDPLFCPKLSCDVYDYIYKGLNQPLLGTFTISVGDIITKTRKERDDLISTTESIIKYLNDKLNSTEEFKESDSQYDEKAKKFNELATVDAADQSISRRSMQPMLTDEDMKEGLLFGKSEKKLPSGARSPLSGVDDMEEIKED